MVYNLVSVKKVIAKVFADLNLDEDNHRISDMIEWCGEGMKKIGAFPSLITKVTGKENVPLLHIHDYQARLPEDLHSINQVAFSTHPHGPFFPMRYATGSFSFNHGISLPYPEGQQYGNNNYSNTTTPTLSQWDQDQQNILDYNNNLFQQFDTDSAVNPVTKDFLENLSLEVTNLTMMNNNSQGGTTKEQSNEHGTIMTHDHMYNIEGGWLKTNIKHGYLLLSYQAIPVDSDFYPMIPDDESFFEALYWYINMKLTYPEWKAGRVKDSVYFDTKSSWNYYRKQAYAQAMMPNGDQLESLKNLWIRLIPRINEEKNFYSKLGQQEVMPNPNFRNGYDVPMPFLP